MTPGINVEWFNHICERYFSQNYGYYTSSSSYHNVLPYVVYPSPSTISLWPHTSSIVSSVEQCHENNGDVYYKVKILNTKGPNHMGFKSSIDELQFFNLIEKCPVGIKVVFIDRFEQTIREVIK